MAFAKSGQARMDTTQDDSSSSNCPLLTMAQELRDIIYDFCLTSDSAIVIWGNNWFGINEKTQLPGAMIICTCKQIRDEAEHLIYKNNTFVIDFDLFLGRSPIQKFRNVTYLSSIAQYLLETGRLSDDHPTHTIDKFFPIEKVRKLELRLGGPGCSMGPSHLRARSTTEPEFRACRLAVNLQLYLASCIARCEDLEQLRLVTHRWVEHSEVWYLRELIECKLVAVACSVDIEWFQMDSGFQEMWLGKPVDTLKAWTTEKVTCVVKKKEEKTAATSH